MVSAVTCVAPTTCLFINIDIKNGLLLNIINEIINFTGSFILHWIGSINRTLCCYM